MATLPAAVETVRAAVVAVGRVHLARPAQTKKGKMRPASWNIAIVGTAWCIFQEKYLVTAYHLFNGGKPRDPGDKFYAFAVPRNQEQAYRYPVVGFPLEKPDLDLAIIEVGPSAVSGVHLSALPITIAPVPDGTRVVTVGFPAPEIKAASIDPQGNWLGAQMFLKSHANEGIVSAQYDVGQILCFELNVGWHHGESGGPIARLDDPIAAFSVMQHYRNISGPHGVVAGPHRGCALSLIQQELQGLGARFV